MHRLVIPLLVIAAALPGMAQDSQARLRLANGEPLVGIYFFTHWWEPWRSSDEAILKDLKHLRSLGINTIFLDHEWSQMIDGDWRLLDRAHRLASESGMQILPWLSLKTWVDMGSTQRRRELVERQYGVKLRTGTDANGKENGIVIPYDPTTIAAGSSYVRQYLRRYTRDGALLYLDWNGKSRPAVALTVECEWKGSCDDTTQLMFRMWLKQKYDSIEDLNNAWKTGFDSFEQVDLCDSSVFDLDGHAKGVSTHPQAVEDHIEFRSQIINESLVAMKKQVRKEFPDVLIVTELPYQIECEHPHGRSYRVHGGANPSATEHADILVIRSTGLLSEAEEKAHLAFKKRTGMKTVLTYRTYQHWGADILSGKMKREDILAYASEASRLAEGFGFYSFNEMVDTHLAPDPNPPLNPANRPVSAKESEAALAAIGEMVKAYKSANQGAQ